ncbi:MAG: hypothetical protein V4601_14745 [Pseudomonadota bacterium]
MNLRNQDGGALLFVTMVGLVISLGFGLFMGSTVVGESRAIEAQLARSRAYWAEMGVFNYGLSRIAASKFCNGCLFQTNVKDTDLAPILQAYFNELTNYRVWTYLDEAAGYSITTSVTAAADNTPGRQNFSGWLMATSAYTPSALVASSSGQLPLMELRVCVGLAYSGDECGPITINNGGNATSYYSINRLTNLPSP